VPFLFKLLNQGGEMGLLIMGFFRVVQPILTLKILDTLA